MAAFIFLQCYFGRITEVSSAFSVFQSELECRGMSEMFVNNPDHCFKKREEFKYFEIFIEKKKREVLG
jgi:hypothetical protein